jgi:hypothetical protein
VEAENYKSSVSPTTNKTNIMIRWTSIILQKTRAAALLGVVLLLVLCNNLYQSRQFEKLSRSFSSLYKDRLLAESYIYRISELLHSKTEIMDREQYEGYTAGDYSQVIVDSGPLISSLMELYRHTKFTAPESERFGKFQQTMERLRQQEIRYMSLIQQGKEASGLKASIQTLVNDNLRHLAALSEIQVKEGKTMAIESRSLLDFNDLSSQLEVIVLIIIAILIQILVFASRSARSLIQQHPSLN